MLIEDIDPAPENVEQLFEAISMSFSHILRLSSTSTHFKGAATLILRGYVDKIHNLVNQFADRFCSLDDQDNVDATGL